MNDAAWQFPSDLLVAFLGGLVLGALLLWLWSRARIALLQDRLRRSEEGAGDELRFEALAGRVLERSSRELLERSREQLESIGGTLRADWAGQRETLRHLIEPVDKTLGELGGQVRALERERQGAYEGLRQEIQLLRQAHGELRNTTVTLQQALKSSRARGRWGEVQLRRVVEMAGMTEHIDFVEQPTAEGVRPDMIVHLPGRGVLPVDAKAPMSAFLEATAATDETARRGHFDDHLKALRQRTVELGQRRYWDQFDATPDFVVMFLPYEASLGSAFERDPDFLDFAMRHRVLPATPVTLLALLRSVAYGWQRQRVAENARQIAQLGRELHDRLGRFLDHLRRLGQGLGSAVRAYNRSLGSLERRVLPAARRLGDTGAAVDPLPEAESVTESVRRPAVSDPPGVDD